MSTVDRSLGGLAAPVSRRRSLTWSISLTSPGLVIVALAAVAAFLLAFGITAISRHAPLDISEGLASRLLVSTVPLVAGVVAALAVASPWRGYLAALLLMPYLDAGQIAWQLGPLQVLGQTLVVAALVAGVALRAVRESDAAERPAGTTDGTLRRLLGLARREPLLAAAVGLLAIGVISTIASPDSKDSLQVFAHGVAEPVAMGLLFFALRPDRRRIMQLVVVLGLSVALGSVINLIQTLPTIHFPAWFLSNRIYFARLTYFNVGLFGEVLAMALPLLAGALAFRSALRLGRGATAVLAAAFAVSFVCLLISAEKSAWLGAAAGMLTLLFLLARRWRTRLAIVATVAVMLTVVVPWPAYLLRDVAPAIAHTDQRFAISLEGQGRFDSWNPSTVAGQHSIVERVYVMEAAFRMAVDHPILGIGLDQFASQYAAHYRPASATLALDSAHGLWPEVAAELGLVALAIVVLLFLGALWSALRVYRTTLDSNTRALAATILGASVAWIFVATAFAGDLYRPWRHMASDFVMAAVIAAAALALSRVAGGVRRPRTPDA